MFTLEDAREAERLCGLIPGAVPLEQIKKGLNVEREHGSMYGFNVTKDRLKETAYIVAAHLAEFPDYYERLERMEAEADAHWRGRRKPKIFY